MNAQPPAPHRVAVIGTGRMGGAMALRLCGAGFEVTVYNRSREKAEAVAASPGAAGVRVADSAREAAGSADAVLVSLADDAAVRAVYAAAGGLVAGLRPGSVVLETSTIAPGTVAALHELVAERGAALLDAPVSGSVAFVEQGKLSVLAGGSGEALEWVRPVLEPLAERIFQVGPSGSGATMKLAVNSVVHALNQALSEALVLAERAGVERERAYEIFSASAVAAPFVHYKRHAYTHPEEASVAFTLDLVAKDLDLVLALAEHVGAPMPQTTANRGCARAAGAAGFADRDMSAMAAYLRLQGHRAE